MFRKRTFFANIYMMNYYHNKPDIRERALKHGLQYPSDEELVMLILGSGTKNVPIRRLSRKVVETLYKSNNNDVIKNLASIKGMGTGKTLAIAAALELGRRKNAHMHHVIKQPKDVVPFVKQYSVMPKEHFLSITLDGRHAIIQIHVVTIGTINKVLVHPREIFSDALSENAAAVIVCHNHPSGTCEPSENDILTTQTLIDAARILDITLLDHIILDRDTYFSFLEHNMLFKHKRQILTHA